MIKNKLLPAVVIIASLLVGAYFLLGIASNNEEDVLLQSLKSQVEKNIQKKDKPVLFPGKSVITQKPFNKHENTKAKTSLINKRNNVPKEISEANVSTNNLDLFANQKDMPEPDPLSIGEYIPATTPEMIKADEEYRLVKDKKYTVLIETEIQKEFATLNNLEEQTVGLEIGDYIQVDGIISGSFEGIEIGEYIPAEPK